MGSELFANVVCRYGEIVDVNLVRDKGTGKSKGFAFIAYEDQRSTNLAVGWSISRIAEFEFLKCNLGIICCFYRLHSVLWLNVQTT